ncbi:ribosome small subunit-dependent GTPase A [Marinicrinis lubricantis]|uniref:Small ribosomal subunit biogenesis GTPase RsgA n=1 Tax=Marinicrinis lubricantis TaxID=2086470 RepID=A0ABW1IMN5_9BACL
MPEGLIIKALSGYYYVLPEEAQEHRVITCRARGVFKKRGLSPLVGDRVKYELSGEAEGTVTEILPRRTELIRPPMANAETAVLVFSVAEPDLNLQLLDKFLVHVESAGLQPFICFTKRDLIRDEKGKHEVDAAERLYSGIGYPVFITSAIHGMGFEPVKEALKGKIGVFAGQSGVGKSSMLNALVPGLRLETNAISQKLGRGKHTTRHVELIRLTDDAWIADTPGFSQLDFMDLEPVQLGNCFVEFVPFAESCRFRGCLHHNEPGCSVIEAVEQGRIASSRYKHYLIFLQEMKDKKRRY